VSVPVPVETPSLLVAGALLLTHASPSLSSFVFLVLTDTGTELVRGASTGEWFLSQEGQPDSSQARSAWVKMPRGPSRRGRKT
jgi:hypothetical protein